MAESFTTYTSPDEIAFDVDTAFAEGRAMAKALRTAIRKLGNLSKDRRAAWRRKIELVQGLFRILKSEPPLTKIGLYGVTGAGKSSIINALLDAGTTAITEICYHEEDQVKAEIKFISEDDWKATISVVLDACKDAAPEDRKNGQRLKTDYAFDIAWSQVRAVYPKLALSHISEMSIGDIISSDQGKDAKTFASQIGVFIGTNEFRSKRASKFASVKEQPTRDIATDAILWPLVDRVKIYSNAPTLSSGIVLVDLPGTGDTNHARARIAMQNLDYCDKIWVAAPIVRAISDKIAKDLLGESFRRQMTSTSTFNLDCSFCSHTGPVDGSYNSKTLSFIATKTDEISCEDIIHQLNLINEPKLCDIEEEIEACIEEMEQGQEEHGKIRESIQEKEMQLASLTEHFNALYQCSRNSQTTSDIGSKRLKQPEGEESGPSSKRVKSEAGSLYHTQRKTNTKTKSAEDKIASKEEEISELRFREGELAKALVMAKAKKLDADKSKSTFCSLARSKDACLCLKNDFQQGLMDTKHTKAEDLLNMRLPVFCTSAIEYGKLKGFLKGDGEASCFADMKDTGIPALRKWCYSLTASSKEKATRQYFLSLQALAGSILRYVEDSSQHDNIERANLKAKWGETAEESIEHRLTKAFNDLVDAAVKKLMDEWSDILKSACNHGALRACEEAHSICERSLNFQSLNHRTIIATAVLTHHGKFKYHKDLNECFSGPLCEAIMPTWTEFFQIEFFQSLETSVCDAVDDLFVEIQEGSGDTLSTMLDKTMYACSRDACSAIISETSAARKGIEKEQKALSRSISHDIKLRLKRGYKCAIDLDMQGKGSTVKRRELFIQHIDRYSKQVFEGTAQTIMTKIIRIIEDAAFGLKSSLQSLACDIQAEISNVWKDEDGGTYEMRARAKVQNVVEMVSVQVGFWQERTDSFFAEVPDVLSSTSFP
ncbi:hypothetical protein DENSPDRAFT_853205 [Dentipellis sp. KUC8613]|nr:hypothetical protein DENSPDRAFT_853205 [Dentipellis sp. KUC8613]